MATLISLLTDSEKDKVNSIEFYGAPIDTLINFKDITIDELSRLAFILIETEYGGKVPECVLSAEAINILTNRAIERNIKLY